MSEPVAVTPPDAAIATATRRRNLLIAIIAGAVVLLLLVAGGVWALAAFVLGTNESPTKSAVAFPANTIYWTELAINPSNGQKVASLGFIDKLDSLRDVVDDSDLDIDFDDPGSNDLRKTLWKLLTDSDNSSIDTDLDYDDDIEPWLGNRIAVGVLPGADLAKDGPQVVVAIEAKNTSAGIDAMEEFVDDLNVDADVSDKNGYVVITTDNVDADKIYDHGTLADTAAFKSAAKDSGAWGLVSYYADLGALSKLYASATTVAGDFTDLDYWREEISTNPYSYVPYADYDYDNNGYEYQGVFYEDFDVYAAAYVADNLDDLAKTQVDRYQGIEDSQKALEKAYDGSSIFGVLRFDAGVLELGGSAIGVKENPEPGVKGSPLASLPDSTVIAASIAGVADAVSGALDDDNLSLLSTFGLGAFGGVGQAPSISRDDVVKYFHDNFAIDFPDDLDTLFGNQVTLAMGEDADFDAFSQGSSGFSEGVGSGFAVVISTDNASKTASAWKKVLSRLEESGGADLGLKVKADGGRVVISAGDFLDEVLEPDARLGGAESFQRALPAAGSAYSSLYIDIDTLSSLIEDVTGSDNASDYLDGLDALGFTTSITGKDSYSYVFRLTAEKD